MIKKRQTPSRNRRPVPTNCIFCTEGINPNYKEPQALEKFVTDRKKIIGRSRSGVCARHQRHLSRAIKRARHLALMPFSGN